MLAFGTEWTDISWAVVNQTMADHLILALETFPAFRSGASRYGTIMRPTLAVDVLVGTRE